MGQSKVLVVGFRGYEVLKTTATSAGFTELNFANLNYAERLFIQTTNDVVVKFDHITGDELTIKTTTGLDFHKKCAKLWVKAVSTNAVFEVCGFKD